MDILAQFEARQIVKPTPEFWVGDTVRVHQKIKDGDKERIQIFEGLVISRKHGVGINASFAVRKVASGVGVERTYPLHSPFIEKIDVVRSSKIRRAKLYFIRTAKGKRGRLKELRDSVGSPADHMKKDEAVEEVAEVKAVV